MDFALSDEQEALAASERAWLAKNDPIAARREHIDDIPAAIPAVALQHLAESGLVGLLTRDLGGTHVDLAVLVEEHGRAASPTPLAELALAARLLEGAAGPIRRHLESAVNGDGLLPLALPARNAAPVSACVDGDVVRLSGATAPVAGLPDAQSALLAVTAEDGTDLVARLPLNGAEGVRTRPLETLDLTRAWTTVELDTDVTADDWSPVAHGAVEAARDAAALYRVMDALGGAARLLDETVEYASQRHQFGSPIGSFQAVKHHCADMAVAVESSRAALWAGAVALDSDDVRASRRAVAAAAAHAGEATSTTAATALQVHGGIGFTWEHDLHLFIRRIKVDELLDGTVSTHRRELALL